jgi:hypothetical protein
MVGKKESFFLSLFLAQMLQMLGAHKEVTLVPTCRSAVKDWLGLFTFTWLCLGLKNPYFSPQELRYLSCFSSDEFNLLSGPDVSPGTQNLSQTLLHRQKRKGQRVVFP